MDARNRSLTLEFEPFDGQREHVFVRFGDGPRLQIGYLGIPPRAEAFSGLPPLMALDPYDRSDILEELWKQKGKRPYSLPIASSVEKALRILRAGGTKRSVPP